MVPNNPVNPLFGRTLITHVPTNKINRRKKRVISLHIVFVKIVLEKSSIDSYPLKTDNTICFVSGFSNANFWKSCSIVGANNTKIPLHVLFPVDSNACLKLIGFVDRNNC